MKYQNFNKHMSVMPKNIIINLMLPIPMMPSYIQTVDVFICTTVCSTILFTRSQILLINSMSIDMDQVSGRKSHATTFQLALCHVK